MTRKLGDLCCADCDRPMWMGKGTLPQGQARCRDCRRRQQERPCAMCALPTRNTSYCSHACRGLAQNGICEICGKRFPRKNNHGVQQRTCGRTCGQVLRNRHSVSVHQRPVRGQQMAAVLCLQCGALVLPGRKLCSTECTQARNRDNSAQSYLRRRNTLRRVIYCLICDASWCRIDSGPGRGRSTCSPECAQVVKRRNNLDYGKNDRQRARYFGVAYEPIKRPLIYERDEWVCGLCSRPVDRTLSGQHRWGPTLDHCIPMSLGGPHLKTNVQLAHRACNEDKGARLVARAPRPRSAVLPDGYLHLTVGGTMVNDLPSGDLVVSLWRTQHGVARLVTRRLWSVKRGWGSKIATT